MVINKELLKSEIDKMPEHYLEILYRIIQAFLNPLNPQTLSTQKATFIQETYGCLADDPIERAEQGIFEVRDTLG